MQSQIVSSPLVKFSFFWYTKIRKVGAPMLTKKNDFYKDLNLSGDLTDIEIDFDGDCEGLEDFLKKEKQEDSELQDTNQAEQKD